MQTREVHAGTGIRSPVRKPGIHQALAMLAFVRQHSLSRKGLRRIGRLLLYKALIPAHTPQTFLPTLSLHFFLYSWFEFQCPSIPFSFSSQSFQLPASHFTHYLQNAYPIYDPTVGLCPIRHSTRFWPCNPCLSRLREERSRKSLKRRRDVPSLIRSRVPA